MQVTKLTFQDKGAPHAAPVATPVSSPEEQPAKPEEKTSSDVGTKKE